MDAICGRPGDYSHEDSTCLCRPSYRFEGISLEHGTLGIVQLAKAAYLIVWLRMHRRGAVHDSSEHSSLMVLPVYARFLKIESINCKGSVESPLSFTTHQHKAPHARRGARLTEPSP